MEERERENVLKFWKCTPEDFLVSNCPGIREEKSLWRLE
jgi:hypothetical protein